MKIYKYEVPITENPTINMEVGAKILSFQIQRGKPVIWALVNPNAPTEERWFTLVGTGMDLPEYGDLEFIGTIQMESGDLVWHLFEEMRK